MSNHLTSRTLGAVMAALLALPLAAADEVSLRKDLTAVIALHGLPCGQVVDAVRKAENDYIASCQDGNRYRVFTNPEGRVVVQRQ